uniref:glutathione transferase n=1 Tax=Sus scrofa TaxID=9823 RepID=A0A8D1EIA4_PIG
LGSGALCSRSQLLVNLCLLFLQLPYLIDGAHKLTQSNAILRYIARKHNMCECGWGVSGEQVALPWPWPE